MNGKAFSLQSCILALFVSLPLFRPILLAHKLIYLVYAVFALSFCVLLMRPNVIKYSNSTQLTLLFAYTGMSIIASVVAVQDIPFDSLGLLCFLPISYLVGVWLGTNGSTHWFFRAASVIFLPIALYIVYQLTKSSFSYNTYYYWSTAAYKIDYLTASLYAGVLLIYFFFNGRNVLEKYGITVLCLGFIAISGARYSIIFSTVAGVYMMFRNAQIVRTILITGSVGAWVLAVLVLFNDTLSTKFVDSVNYSLFRLENLSGNDTSVKGRVALIEKASEIIVEHFSFGVGLAGSEKVLGNYPHNMLLEAFVDGGIVSMLLLLAFLVHSILVLIKLKHEDKAWCLLLVLYLLGAFMKSFSIYESRILFFFIGYAATLITREVLVWEGRGEGAGEVQDLAPDTRSLNSNDIIPGRA
jgi:O-antigen ligase